MVENFLNVRKKTPPLYKSNKSPKSIHGKRVKPYIVVKI
jgi:hypothetical protein